MSISQLSMALNGVFGRRQSRGWWILLCLALSLFYFVDVPSGISSRTTTKSSNMLRHSLILDQMTGLAMNWTKGDPIHPIDALMEKAKTDWERMKRRQSKTLEEAVSHYRLRYDRDPPKGFDVWYKWARANKIVLIDEYDRIYADTHLFYALSPEEFRRRRQAVEDEHRTWISALHVGPDRNQAAGEDHIDKYTTTRVAELGHLLSSFAALLPDSTKFLVSTQDSAGTMMADDTRRYLEAKIAGGEYVVAESEEFRQLERNGGGDVKGLRSISAACPEGSPAWLEALGRSSGNAGSPTGPRPDFQPKDRDHPMFIHDQRKSNDFCYNPELLQIHGSLSNDATRGTKLKPLFHFSKIMFCPEISISPLVNYQNASYSGSESQYLSWDEKDIAKLQWRGSMTGDSYSAKDGLNWRNSQRVRLHSLSHRKDGEIGIYVRSRRTGRWEWQEWDSNLVNRAYMDVGLTGRPMQCNKVDGTCDEIANEIDFEDRMTPSTAARFKYVIDVDGNGWSSRFHRLMLSGSLILKSTIYDESWTDQMIPWYHYIPVQVSYAELYAVLSFFIGLPGAPSSGHDHLARQIAEQGRDFALNHWRWEDMQSYMFRLLLEYIRLEKDDRDAWSYKL